MPAGIWPLPADLPFLIVLATNLAFGLSSSRFGPTCATACDAASVWQAAQRSPKSSRPCFSASVRLVTFALGMSLPLLTAAITAAGAPTPKTASAIRNTPSANRRLPRDCECSVAPRPRRPPLSAIRNVPRPSRTNARTKRSVLIRAAIYPFDRHQAPPATSRCPVGAPPRPRASSSAPRAEALHRGRELAELAHRRGGGAAALGAFAAGGRGGGHAALGELDDAGLAVLRRDQRLQRLDEHVDRASGLRQAPPPPPAQQQALPRPGQAGWPPGG